MCEKRGGEDRVSFLQLAFSSFILPVKAPLCVRVCVCVCHKLCHSDARQKRKTLQLCSSTNMYVQTFTLTQGFVSSLILHCLFMVSSGLFVGEIGQE